jgi:hypothetical protein
MYHLIKLNKLRHFQNLIVRWVLGSITPRAQVWEQGLVTQILNMEVIGNRVLPLHTELGMIFSGRLLVAHPG